MIKIGVVTLRALVFAGLRQRCSGRRRDGNLRRPRSQSRAVGLRPVSGGTVRATRLTGTKRRPSVHGLSAARANRRAAAGARFRTGQVKRQGNPRCGKVERERDQEDPSRKRTRRSRNSPTGETGNRRTLGNGPAHGFLSLSDRQIPRRTIKRGNYAPVRTVSGKTSSALRKGRREVRASG